MGYGLGIIIFDRISFRINGENVCICAEKFCRCFIKLTMIIEIRQPFSLISSL